MGSGNAALVAQHRRTGPIFPPSPQLTAPHMPSTYNRPLLPPLSLSSSSAIFFKLQIELLRLKRESRIYIWRICKMGARDMEFQGLRSHATLSLEMQNSFRKRSNHSSRCCNTFCCSSRRETTSWMHFIQFSRERVLRGSLSSNFLFQEKLLSGCISSKFLSQRETFILDAFHPSFFHFFLVCVMHDQIFQHLFILLHLISWISLNMVLMVSKGLVNFVIINFVLNTRLIRPLFKVFQSNLIITTNLHIVYIFIYLHNINLHAT
jgi:hypothetical protein